jgi:hypothetical protein
VPPLAQSYPMSSQPPPPTDWVVDSEASYHTTTDHIIVSLPHPHSPTFPSYIIVGNDTSVGDTVLPCLFTSPTSLLPPTSSGTFSRSVASPLTTTVLGNSILGSSPYEILPLVLWLLDATPPVPISHSLPCPTFLYPCCHTLRPRLHYSTSTWHHHLGHPGHDVFSRLSATSAIPFLRGNATSLCHAYQLGRHNCLPFSSSMSRATHPFDLIHCNLWISPTLSISGYWYYLVILEELSHYLWTFPLRRKSGTFTVFLTSLCGCRLSSVAPSGLFSAIMDGSLTTPRLAPLPRRDADVVPSHLPSDD